MKSLVNLWNHHLRWWDLVLLYVAALVTLLVFLAVGFPWEW